VVHGYLGHLGQLVLVHPGGRRAPAALGGGVQPYRARRRVLAAAGRQEPGIPRPAPGAGAHRRGDRAGYGRAHLPDRLGEQHVSSSAAGILTATDPLFTALLALWLIRSEVPGRTRLAGLVIGFAGVIALLGIDLRGSAVQLLGAGAVLLSALGYAAAALVYRRWLTDVPAIGVTAVMTALCSVAFLAPAAVNLPRQMPSASSVLALATLGIINTGVAYWLFYLLIDHAGAAAASVITYVMPVVVLVLGVGLLGEQLTIGAFAGLPLIAVGAWLATSRKPSSTSDQHQPHILPGHGQGDPPPGQRRGGRQAARFLPTLDHNGSPKSGECSHRNQDRRGIRVH
jgi:drug/metabolite transporter (DMT)-like permease